MLTIRKVELIRDLINWAYDETEGVTAKEFLSRYDFFELEFLEGLRDSGSPLEILALYLEILGDMLVVHEILGEDIPSWVGKEYITKCTMKLDILQGMGLIPCSN